MLFTSKSVVVLLLKIILIYLHVANTLCNGLRYEQLNASN